MKQNIFHLLTFLWKISKIPFSLGDSWYVPWNMKLVRHLDTPLYWNFQPILISALFFLQEIFEQNRRNWSPEQQVHPHESSVICTISFFLLADFLSPIAAKFVLTVVAFKSVWCIVSRSLCPVNLHMFWMLNRVLDDCTGHVQMYWMYSEDIGCL